MSFCTKCGLQAESEDMFCAACGQPIRRSVAESVQPQAEKPLLHEPRGSQSGTKVPTESDFPIEHQIRVGAIIRDVVIIWLLTMIGGGVAGLATDGSLNSERFMVAVGFANLLLGTVGFTISGCLAPPRRWRHLGFVAFGVWLSSLLNVVFFGVSASVWAAGAIGAAAMMGIGGAISYLFKKDSEVTQVVARSDQNLPPVITFTAKTTQTPPSAKQTDKAASVGDSSVLNGNTDAGDPAQASSAGAINLLALVNPRRDAVQGHWKLAAAGVTLEKPDAAGVLDLPYAPPEEYDFEVEFTPSSGNNSVNQYLAAAGRSFAWKLNAYGEKPPLYCVDLLDGKSAEYRDEAVAQKPLTLEAGKRYTSKVEVRRGSLRVLVNGEEYLRWSGDFNRLSLDPHYKLHDSRHLGVGSFQRGVTFHRIEIREVNRQRHVHANRAGNAGGTSAPPNPPRR